MGDNVFAWILRLFQNQDDISRKIIVRLQESEKQVHQMAEVLILARGNIDRLFELHNILIARIERLEAQLQGYDIGPGGNKLN